MPVTKTTQKQPTSLVEAQTLADILLHEWKPLCEEGRCVVAGSVRRKAARPGDIEIVCLPKTGTATSPGELLPIEQNLVIHWMNAQHHRRHGISIVKGGPRYHQMMFGTTQVDVFMPLPSQWGRMLALRTGPASYAKKMAARWCEMNYRGVNGELVKIKSDQNNNRFKPDFPTEESFFEFLGWDYLEPEKRQ